MQRQAACFSVTLFVFAIITQRSESFQQPCNTHLVICPRLGWKWQQTSADFAYLHPGTVTLELIFGA